jgi:hypothetical protein
MSTILVCMNFNIAGEPDRHRANAKSTARLGADDHKKPALPYSDLPTRTYLLGPTYSDLPTWDAPLLYLLLRPCQCSNTRLFQVFVRYAARARVPHAKHPPARGGGIAQLAQAAGHTNCRPISTGMTREANTPREATIACHLFADRSWTAMALPAGAPRKRRTAQQLADMAAGSP